jgi:DMSO reductase anchor subunit
VIGSWGLLAEGYISAAAHCGLPSEQALRSPITHVRHVALATEDLAASVAFYDGIRRLYRVGGDEDVVALCASWIVAASGSPPGGPCGQPVCA